MFSQKGPNANISRSLVILVACATGNKKHIRRETGSPKACQLTCSTVSTRYHDSDTSFTEEEEEPFCLQLKILDDFSQEEQSEAEQSQPVEEIEQSNRHPDQKSTQSTKDKNCQAEDSKNNKYKCQVSQAYQEKRRPMKFQMCSDKKSQETSHIWPVLPVIVNYRR